MPAVLAGERVEHGELNDRELVFALQVAFERVSGFSSAAVPWLLVVFGAGLFVGNLLGGRASDRNIQRTLVVVLAVLVVVLVAFALTAGNKVATVISLLLIGGFGFATVPGLQMRIMQHASGAPTMASGANIAAFNVGNALGAWLAGLGLAWGAGISVAVVDWGCRDADWPGGAGGCWAQSGCGCWCGGGERASRTGGRWRTACGRAMRGEALSAEANRVLRRPEFRGGPRTGACCGQ